MPDTPTPLVVTVEFGNLDTFCEELAERGPNIEPVVRICQHVRHGQSDTHGPLPIEHVFGHVSYLRRTEDQLGLPTIDPVRTGVGAIVDRLPG